ncbi:MAG TPA: DoxX family protein [Gemmatimonadales bacterium]
MAQDIRPTAAPPYGSTLADVTLTALRVMAGLLYAQHGAQKLLGAFGGFGGTPGATAPLVSLMGLAGVIELVGGLMIAFGLLTRLVAFVASGEMAFAYFMAHFPRSFWPIENGGEPVVLFCFTFLLFAAIGAGPWSLDAILFGRRRAPLEPARAG